MNLPKIQAMPEQFGFYFNFIIYFVPENTEELSPEQNQHLLSKPSENIESIFIEKLAQQILKKHQQCYIKEWTIQEDQKLLRLGSTCRNWKQLAALEFHGKSSKVCNRRYRKLLKNQIKWPVEDEMAIKHMRQEEGKSWIEIEQYMKEKRGPRPEYKSKKIRQRYKNFLEHEISREKWTVAEDLELWKLVNLLGKVWNQISQYFPKRSGLQIRNRYYKFLEPIVARVNEILSQTNNQSDMNQ